MIFNKKINANKAINKMYYDNRELFLKLAPQVSDKILDKFENAKSEEEAHELCNFFVTSGFYEHGTSEQLRYIKYYNNLHSDIEKAALLTLIMDANNSVDRERNERIETHFSKLLAKNIEEKGEDSIIDTSLYEIPVLELSNAEFSCYQDMSNYALNEEMRQMNLFLIKNYDDQYKVSLLTKMQLCSKMAILFNKAYNKNNEESNDNELLNITISYYTLLFGKTEHKELLDNFDMKLQQMIKEEINRPGVFKEAGDEIIDMIGTENIEKAKEVISDKVETGKRLFKRFKKATSDFVQTMTDDDQK